MKPQAAERTRTLLDNGNIHAGALPGDTYGQTSKETGRDVTVNTALNCYVVLSCSVFNDQEELTSTLLHEGKHVDQLRTKPPLHSYASWWKLNLSVFEAEAVKAEVTDRAP
jgi:hypothetical protein